MIHILSSSLTYGNTSGYVMIYKDDNQNFAQKRASIFR